MFPLATLIGCFTGTSFLVTILCRKLVNVGLKAAVKYIFAAEIGQMNRAYLKLIRPKYSPL